MSNRDFQVLTELYRLLGQFTPEEIAAASRRPTISDSVRGALQALAQEAHGAGVRERSTNRSIEAAGPKKSSHSNGAAPAPERVDSDFDKRLMRFLLDERRFPNKASLGEFASRIGISAATDAKTSRERVARRIAKEVVANAALRSELLKQISQSSPGDEETRGWMELILGKR